MHMTLTHKQCDHGGIQSMQNVFNLFFKRKQSTKRVDDMPSAAARHALDQRMHRMLAIHDEQPLPACNLPSAVSNHI
jgi:hypothetical protein